MYRKAGVQFQGSNREDTSDFHGSRPCKTPFVALQNRPWTDYWHTKNNTVAMVCGITQKMRPVNHSGLISTINTIRGKRRVRTMGKQRQATILRTLHKLWHGACWHFHNLYFIVSNTCRYFLEAFLMGNWDFWRLKILFHLYTSRVFKVWLSWVLRHFEKTATTSSEYRDVQRFFCILRDCSKISVLQNALKKHLMQ